MKIFCIGLSKTGTTSLMAALEMLGYASAHWHYTRNVFRYTTKGIKVRFDKFTDHDAFGDTPIARIYPELDKKFANSKFILTVRDIDQWDKSFREMFGQGVEDKFSSRLHMDLYGTDNYDRDKCGSAFKKHNDQVLRYFKGREQDLLVMNISAGDGWVKLCQFLHKPILRVAFPKRYTKTERMEERTLRQRLLRIFLEPRNISGKIFVKASRLFRQ